MKKLFSFLAIIGIILASNCSRIPENNDPVIGIWSRTEVQTDTSSQGAKSTKSIIRREWIFNDAYLGRFHRYNNSDREVITDFKWSKENGIYTIVYPDPSVNKDDAFVEIQESPDKTTLMAKDGTILAVRE